MNSKIKLKTSWRNFVIILSMAMCLVPGIAQTPASLHYDPIRMVGGRCYSLQPIYDWISLPRDDRSQRPMQEWIGLPKYKFYRITYKVYQIQSDGLLLENSGEDIASIYAPIGDYDSQPLIFLTNYPDANMLVDGQIIQFLALRIGTYTYTGTDNATHTIAEYDYGTPFVPPELTPDQIKAIQQTKKLEALTYKERADQAQVKAMKWLQNNATNGSASTQYSLGLHYLNGQGCETNRELAIYWLKQAAAQGDLQASNKLTAIDP